MGTLPERPSLAGLHRRAKDWLVRAHAEHGEWPTLAEGRAAVAAELGLDSWDAVVTEVRNRRRDSVGDVPEAQVRLLQELSTTESPHSAGTLYDHLCGTRDLLLEWGSTDDLAAAGLFHSIYGTESYRIQSAPLEHRSVVADVIGPRAEELAFLFCVTDRRGFWSQAAEPNPLLHDRVHDTDIPVAPATIDALIEIEVANVVEQVHPAFSKPDRVAGMRSMLTAGEGHMSGAARAAFAALIEECAACAA